MIELPEARTIASDLKKTILGKTVEEVLLSNSPHKFTFFGEDKDQCPKYLKGKKVTAVIPRNYYIEIIFEDYMFLSRDGLNLRYHTNEEDLPKKYQMIIKFTDNTYLSMTVSMYAFLNISKIGKTDNIYYQKELDGISPLDKEFTKDYFKSLINDETKKLSAKAFLATEQRILGIGNGVLQDILYNAKIHPKTKMKDLTETEIDSLYKEVIETINEMISKNGRDTESNIYGTKGNYTTKLSKNTVGNTCKCGGTIKKENYLGGSIYYCDKCQIIKK